MLTSDSVAEDVIRHQNLMAYFKLSDLEKAKTALRGMSKFTTDQNNFLTITVESKEPTTSAKIANEYFAALYRMTARLSNEESEHRLEFMSGPLQVERTKLNEAEAALQKAQEHTGLVVPGAQAAAGVQQIASLQDRISGLEVQLAALRETSTDANPRVISLRSQISNLQGQLAELQRSGSQVNSMGRLPVSSLEVERAQREVQFHSSTLDALMKALATSSLQENYAPSFALIDPAIVLKTKVAPSRKIWFMVGGILGATLGFLWISVPFFFRQWTRSQAGREQIARLKSGAARTRPSARGNA
jgi:tyrosine-protein kinase Etk/Wzc